MVINNAAENQWLVANVLPNASQSARVFIGLTDEAEEASFRWSAGAKDPYRNWNAGEPNNSTAIEPGGEDYVEISGTSGLWNDLRNPSRYLNRVGVVEVNSSAGDPTGIFAGPLVNPANGSTYYILTPALAGSAQRFAQGLGGNLVTVNNAAEQEWLRCNVASIAGTTTTLCIGLNDTAIEGTFVWYSGETSSYRNWDESEPNNLGGIEDQVGMFAASSGGTVGHWVDERDLARHSIAEINAPVFCPADFNRSGSVTVQDVFDFLSAYFSTCP